MSNEDKSLNNESEINEVNEQAKKLKLAEEETYKQLKKRLKHRSKSELIQLLSRESLHSRMVQGMIQQYHLENMVLKQALGEEEVTRIFNEFNEKQEQAQKAQEESKSQESSEPKEEIKE